jgi:hypothetical protein
MAAEVPLLRPPHGTHRRSRRGSSSTRKPTSSPLRNGLLVLVLGLMLCVGLAFALPSVAASDTGRAARLWTRSVGRTASGAPGAPVGEVAKEKELLEALERRGRLTVARLRWRPRSRWRRPTGCSRHWRRRATSRCG